MGAFKNEKNGTWGTLRKEGVSQWVAFVIKISIRF